MVRVTVFQARSLWCSVFPALAPLALTGPLLHPAAGQADARYQTAVIRPGPTPGVRLVSGLTVCDEALVDGHWVNRYWTSTGQIKPEGQIRPGAGADAFTLVLEGEDLAGSWQWVGATQERVHDPDGTVVTVELRSRARPVTVKLHTQLTGGPALVRWLDIVNTGTRATAITRVSPWAGRLWTTTTAPERLDRAHEAPYEVATTRATTLFHEGAWGFDTLGDGTKTVTSAHGRSGWGHPTFFAHNRVTGEWAVASLAWSSNWTMTLRAGPQFTFELGPSTVDQALRVIDPGETVRSPETHLLLLRGDLDAVIQALHAHVRRDVLLPPVPGREYQVEANHLGYIGGHEDEPGMKREIDLAAAVGTEMFVVDAGWFGPDPNDWDSNVGDWYAGSWLPHDLTPVREYARKKGLLFGLWAEIEAIGAPTKLRREHPDWVATRNGAPYLVVSSRGEPLPYGRVLDFANPAVVAWAESEVARLIRKYDLDMFRIDHNYDLGPGASRTYHGFVENTEWRHVEALYAMFDRLHKRFPRVIFQNCSNGGGRLDYGLMHRFHNAEISESMRPPTGLKVLNGVTWVLPPEILLRTFGTEAGGLEEDGNLDFQLRHVMMARPIFRGISPSVAELNPLLARRVRDALALFKRTVRPIMATGLVYHHTPVLPFDRPSPWVVLEYAAPAGDRGVAGVFRIGTAGDPVYHFVPRGLDVSRTYRVRFGNSGRVAEMSGAALLQSGVPVRLEDNLTSEMLIFEAE